MCNVKFYEFELVRGHGEGVAALRVADCDVSVVVIREFRRMPAKGGIHTA